MVVQESNTHAVDLSREDAWQLFDQEARRRLDMTASEFAEKFDAGFWVEPDAVPYVLYVQSVREFAEA